MISFTSLLSTTCFVVVGVNDHALVNLNDDDYDSVVGFGRSGPCSACLEIVRSTGVLALERLWRYAVKMEAYCFWPVGHPERGRTGSGRCWWRVFRGRLRSAPLNLSRIGVAFQCEGHDFVDGCGVGGEHEEAVDAHGDAACFGHAVFEGL